MHSACFPTSRRVRRRRGARRVLFAFVARAGVYGRQWRLPADERSSGAAQVRVTVMRMPLEPPVVDWLRARLCATADDLELDRCYAFAHDLNDERDVACNPVDPNDTTQTLNWGVRFYNGAGECLHHEDGWASRAAQPSMPRWGGLGVGPVALNHYFQVEGRVSTPALRDRALRG